jgi:hypothetical protein
LSVSEVESDTVIVGASAAGLATAACVKRAALLLLVLLGAGPVAHAHEETDRIHRSTNYFQVAPFLSGGFVWLGFRAAFPLGQGPVYGRELGLVFTLRIPLIFDGDVTGRPGHSS